MERKRSVAAIVAAYNEEERVGNVLRVLASYPGFDEVIVVDDGSSDATSEAVRMFPVRLIRHEKNLGKGEAMQTGVEHASADVLFFCDADVKGLSHGMLEETLAPVLHEDVDMVIAMRNRKIYYLSFVLTVIPLLGGERAMTRALWERVPAKYKSRFMIEAALNFYAKYYGKGYGYKVFPGLTQTIKEKKYGFWKGFTARVRMFFEVISAQLRLYREDLPRDHRGPVPARRLD